MQTTILKTVKGETMEKLFDNSNLINIRYFKAINLLNEEDYNPENRYKYEITIRHEENVDVDVLFEEARFNKEILKK